MNRRTNVPAPKAGHMVKPPDDVIRAHGAKQEHIQGQGGGTDVAVPEHEAAEQPGLRTVGGVVEDRLPSTRNRNMSRSPR